MGTRLQKQKVCRYRIFNFFANAKLYFFGNKCKQGFCKENFRFISIPFTLHVFLTIEVNLHSKGVWYWTYHLQFNHVSKLGAGRGLFGHITPFKQQREWVCCFYLCTLNTAVYFTQKQKNVSKWLKVCQNAAGQVPYEKKLRLKEHTKQNKGNNKRILWWIQYLVNTRK